MPVEISPYRVTLLWADAVWQNKAIEARTKMRRFMISFECLFWESESKYLNPNYF
jgi:hypothetical protein